MNGLYISLTIYALLCSNVVVHLSDHNPVMVAQVDYYICLSYRGAIETGQVKLLFFWNQVLGWSRSIRIDADLRLCTCLQLLS